MKKSMVKKACLCSKSTNVFLDIFFLSIWKYFPDISDSENMTYLSLSSRGALSTKALWVSLMNKINNFLRSKDLQFQLWETIERDTLISESLYLKYYSISRAQGHQVKLVSFNCELWLFDWQTEMTSDKHTPTNSWKSLKLPGLGQTKPKTER